MGSTGSATTLDVDSGMAHTVARLLDALSEMPSTPAHVSDEAAVTAREITRHLPYPHGPEPAPATVELNRWVISSAAGLFGLFAGMPSTPPDLRAQAQERAEMLWKLVAGSG